MSIGRDRASERELAEVLERVVELVEVGIAGGPIHHVLKVGVVIRFGAAAVVVAVVMQDDEHRVGRVGVVRQIRVHHLVIEERTVAAAAVFVAASTLLSTCALSQASYRYIARAVELSLSGGAAGAVTAPINKEALNLAGHHFDGHTGMLAHLTGSKSSFMLLASEKLKVIHVSTHVSLRDAIGRATPERILETVPLLLKEA